VANVKLLATMPEVPPIPPPIYTLLRPNAGEERLLNLARTFGLKAHEEAGSIHRSASKFTYTEANFDVEMYRASGYLTFKNRAHWQVDRGAAAELSDEDAATRASELLRSSRLLPERWRVQKVSRLAVASAGPNRAVQDRRVIDVGVHVQPLLHEIPVDGPGGRVNVYLDHQREVTCIEYCIRSINAVYRVVDALRSPADALEEADRAWSARRVHEVEVREVRLCYFELGPNVAQIYLEPAYMILATLVGRDSRIRTGDIFVTPAAVNTAGSLTGLTPPRPPVRSPRGQSLSDAEQRVQA
jgi:hypothetical protein